MLCNDSTHLLLALKVEDRVMSQGKWTPVETGKGEETDSPLEPQQEGSPAHTLVFAQGDPCWTSDLWNCHRLVLFQITNYVTSAIENKCSSPAL